MHRARISILILIGALVGSAATALVIPTGTDRWVTLGDGGTFFTFPEGDVESLCGAEADPDWDRSVILEGAPEPGQDWDTVIKRLDDVDVSHGSATVQTQVTHMALRSVGSHETPCGPIDWYLHSLKHQPVTTMRIHNTSGKSGRFEGALTVRLGIQALDPAGDSLGLLYYTLDLAGMTSTAWSIGPLGRFRPGIDKGGLCSRVVRDELPDRTTRHTTFVENRISRLRCLQKKTPASPSQITPSDTQASRADSLGPSQPRVARHESGVLPWGLLAPFRRGSSSRDPQSSCVGAPGQDTR